MKERISALMDGELEDREAAGAIASVVADAEARDTWREYHLISDAMRDTRLLSPGFAERVAQRLEGEPTVLAPRRLAAEPRPWYAVPAAAAAGIAGVGLVGWLAFAPQPQGPVVAISQEAKIPEKPIAQVPLPNGTPDYLLAHQGFSPRVSLQGMAPYARTVSARANEGRK